jgi:hypothetical protein
MKTSIQTCRAARRNEVEVAGLPPVRRQTYAAVVRATEENAAADQRAGGRMKAITVGSGFSASGSSPTGEGKTSPEGGLSRDTAPTISDDLSFVNRSGASPPWSIRRALVYAYRLAEGAR